MHRVQLPWIGSALGHYPGNDIGYLLVSQGCRGIRSPVGHTSIGYTGNGNTSDGLIADQCKIRLIHNRAYLVSVFSCATFSVTGCTGNNELLLPTCNVPGQNSLIRRWILTCQQIRFAPKLDHAVGQDSHLLIGKRATRSFRKGGHQLSRNAFGRSVSERLFSSNGEIDRIRKRDRGAVAPVRAVTTGAVRLIERFEIQHLFRPKHLRPWAGAAGNVTASQCAETDPQNGEMQEGNRADSDSYQRLSSSSSALV